MFDLLMSAAGAAASFIKGKDEKVESKGLSGLLDKMDFGGKFHYINDEGGCESIFDCKDILERNLGYMPDSAFDEIIPMVDELSKKIRFRDVFDFLDEVKKLGYLKTEPVYYVAHNGEPMIVLDYGSIIRCTHGTKFRHCHKAGHIEAFSESEFSLRGSYQDYHDDTRILLAYLNLINWGLSSVKGFDVLVSQYPDMLDRFVKDLVREYYRKETDISLNDIKERKVPVLYDNNIDVAKLYDDVADALKMYTEDWCVGEVTDEIMNLIMTNKI